MIANPEADGMTLTEAVGAVLRGARAEARLTQDEVEEATGIPPISLNRIENAKRDINVERLAKLAELYDMTPHEVMVRAEERVAKSLPHARRKARRPPPPKSSPTDTESSGP